jgi:hypothetical protein
MDESRLVQLVAQNKSSYQIAEILGCSPTNVKYWLNKFGLKTSPGSKPHKCGVCGETDSNKFYGHKRRTCGECHKDYTKRLGHEKRLFAINHLGAECQICGYKQFSCSLDVHHVDSNKKDPNFGSMRGWSIERIIKELKHCTLLCKNCHAAVHSNKLSNSQ